MASRAYLLVNVQDGLDQQEFGKAVADLEGQQEVEFVDAVVGNWDLVIMIEAPVTVDAVAKKIEVQPWVKELQIQKIISLAEHK